MVPIGSVRMVPINGDRDLHQPINGDQPRANQTAAPTNASENQIAAPDPNNEPDPNTAPNQNNEPEINSQSDRIVEFVVVDEYADGDAILAKALKNPIAAPDPIAMFSLETEDEIVVPLDKGSPGNDAIDETTLPNYSNFGAGPSSTPKKAATAEERAQEQRKYLTKEIDGSYTCTKDHDSPVNIKRLNDLKNHLKTHKEVFALGKYKCKFDGCFETYKVHYDMTRHYNRMHEAPSEESKPKSKPKKTAGISSHEELSHDESKLSALSVSGSLNDQTFD